PVAGAAHPRIVVRVVISTSEVGPVVMLVWVSRSADFAIPWLAASPLNPHVESLITSVEPFPGVVSAPPLVAFCCLSSLQAVAAHDIPDDLLRQSQLGCDFALSHAQFVVHVTNFLD